MTQDEIIEMARQVGLFEITKDGYEVFYPDNLEAFAKLVAAKEREACAKAIDEVGMFHEVSQGADLCFDLSKAIRARGESK